MDGFHSARSSMDFTTAGPSNALRPVTGGSSSSGTVGIANAAPAAMTTTRVPTPRSSAGSVRDLGLGVAAVVGRSSSPIRASSPAPSRSSQRAPSPALYSVAPARQRSNNAPQRSSERLVEAPPPRLPVDPYAVYGSYGAAPLPEMHPSALDRTPSRSAPFPPSPPRPVVAPPLAVAPSIPPPLTAHNAGPGAPIPGPRLTSAYFQDVHFGGPSTRPSPAPVSLAQPAEVCVECMMRDRDMADVDVTTPGMWSRESDIDFIDALRVEEAEDAADDFNMVDRRASLASSQRHGTSMTDESAGGPSRESSSIERNLRAQPPSSLRSHYRHRISRGHLVSQPSLKLWTSMNPPASSHRWRTLQKYLREQERLLRAERAGNEGVELTQERDSAVYRERRQSTSSSSVKRGRASTVMANGMTLERVDIEGDEREARQRSKQQRRRRMSTTSQQRLDLVPPSPRRLSSPMLGDAQYAHAARSSTDLRSLAAMPRSPSPGRSSIAYSDRPRSSIFWPSSVRALGHRSASASVLSLAPSGSMIDMHLGLSMDKHLPALPTSRSGDVASMVSADQRSVASASGKKRRRGLSKIFSKLTLGGQPSPPLPNDGQVLSAPALTSVRAGSGAFDDYFATATDEPLAPPNPSYLAERRRRFSHSLGSTSSAPASPSTGAGGFGILHDPAGPRSISSPLPVATPLTPQSSFSRPTASSVMTTDSPILHHGAYIGGEPLTLTSSPVVEMSEAIHGGGLRKEKSLPALPVDWPTDDAKRARAVSTYELAPPLQPFVANDELNRSNGRRSAASTKSGKRLFGGMFGRSKAKSASTTTAATPADMYAPHEETLDAIVRDQHFLATRYPSAAVAT